MVEGDNLRRTVDVGDHAARFRSAEATEIGAQAAQLDLVRFDGVDVKWMATFVAPVSPSQSSSGALVDRSASGLNTLRPHSSAIAGAGAAIIVFHHVMDGVQAAGWQIHETGAGARSSTCPTR